MAEQYKALTTEELRRAIQNKEHELSELDLMLADYHKEHLRLIKELRHLLSQLYDAVEEASATPKS